MSVQAKTSGEYKYIITDSGVPDQVKVNFNLGPANHTVIIPSDVCLLAFRGSVAHNMCTISEPDSIDDIDLMGVGLAPAYHYLGLREHWAKGTREIKDGPYDTVLYEIRKMFGMLLNGNPNIMSLLWVQPEHYIMLTEAGRRIVENRHLFVGKHLFQPFAGYAHGQLLKAESRDPAELRDYIALTAEAKSRGIHPQHKGEIIPYSIGYDHTSGETRNAKTHSNDVLLAKLTSYMKKGDNTGYMGDKRKQLILKHGVDTKNLGHCIRLLRMITEFLYTGEMSVFRPDADELLEIKRGQWTLERAKQHADELYAEAKVAYEASTLPEQPDREGAEKLLISILQDHLAREA